MKNNEHVNKNRTLRIAKSLIPKDVMDLYGEEICNECEFNNISENRECCYCQDGSFYTRKGRNKI